MAAYIQRRKRWWVKLRTLDGEIVASDGILAYLLLEGVRLDHTQKLMIMTVCEGRLTFDRVADALRKQHARIHERDRMGKVSGGKGPRWTTLR